MDAFKCLILMIVLVVRIRCEQLDKEESMSIEEPLKKTLPGDDLRIKEPDESAGNENGINSNAKDSETKIHEPLSLQRILEVFGLKNLKMNEKQESMNVNIALSFKTPDVDVYPGILDNFLNSVNLKIFDKPDNVPELVDRNSFDSILKDGVSLINNLRLSLTDMIQRVKRFLILSHPDNRMIMETLENLYEFTSQLLKRDEEVNTLPLAFLHAFHSSTKENVSSRLTKKNSGLSKMVEKISEEIFKNFFSSDMEYLFKDLKNVKIKITGENKNLKKLYKRSFQKLVRTVIKDYEINKIPLNSFVFFGEKFLQKIEKLRNHKINFQSRRNQKAPFKLSSFQNFDKTSDLMNDHTRWFENYMDMVNKQKTSNLPALVSEQFSKLLEDVSFLRGINKDILGSKEVDQKNIKKDYLDQLHSSIETLEILRKMFKTGIDF